jgi:hypothetical protein
MGNTFIEVDLPCQELRSLSAILSLRRCHHQIHDVAAACDLQNLGRLAPEHRDTRCRFDHAGEIPA